jgi:hypothetical protein
MTTGKNREFWGESSKKAGVLKACLFGLNCGFLFSL